MTVNINDKTINAHLNRQLDKAQKEEANSLAKLASGSRFDGSDPIPADRAIAEKMEYKIRSLNAAKRNINDGISLLQTAESSMGEINNMVTRLKEINIAAANTTVSDQERRFLMIEYEAIHDEINRISVSTEFNGIPLLNGRSEKAPETLIFRVGDPFYANDSAIFDSDTDVNVIKLENFRNIDTTTKALGLSSAKKLLLDSSDEEGISLSDVEEMLMPRDTDGPFPTAYDQAISTLSMQRAVFGGIQTRMNKAMDFIDVYEENIMAAKSKVADTDYASEVSNLIKARINSSATTSLLAQSQFDANLTLKLLNTGL